MDLSPDLSPFLLDLDLDFKAMDLDLDSDLKVLPASPFFKSFVSTKYRSISELLLGKMRQCVGASKPTCKMCFGGASVRHTLVFTHLIHVNRRPCAMG